MEMIDTPPLPTPSPAPVDVPPLPTPAPAPAPLPMPPQQFASGGETGIKGFFKGVSFTEVGMIALATAAMCTIIFYYRQRIKHLKEEKSTVQGTVEELQMNVMNMMGPSYKKI